MVAHTYAWVYYNDMDKPQPTKPKRIYTHAFTCNLPVPFFERLEKLAAESGKPIRDVLMEAAERGLSDER